jgi:anaerobic ribonucleoside-triphosphate reductase activating protein
MDVDELVSDILSMENMDGVTITGGEPLDQIEAVTELCKKLYGKISTFMTTGYTLDQIKKRGYTDILNTLDILCAGPFDKNLICSGEWKGSSNQEILYLTNLGKKQSQMPVVLKEFFIQPNGTTIETGFTV